MMKLSLSPRVCICIALICQIAAAGLTKFAALSLPEYSAGSVVRSWPYFLSLACLALNGAVWPVVLSGYKLSVACFLMSIVYVGILITSAMVFREAVSAGNVIGALLIVFGVNVMGWRNGG